MTPEEFREAVRDHFRHLVSDYGFHEETPRNPSDFLTEYVSDKTRIIVEGPCWDSNVGVYLTAVDSSKVRHGSYPLSDLLKLRGVNSQVPEHEEGKFSEEIMLGQMRAYAQALRENASDILRGDHTVFPILANRTDERLRELDKRR